MTTIEARGRICPICRRHFADGDVCPEDGGRLVPALPRAGSQHPVPAESPAPPEMFPHVRAPRKRAWAAWTATLALAAGVVAIARCDPHDGASPGHHGAAAAAPAAAALAAPPSREPPPPPAPPPPAAPAETAVQGVTDAEIRLGMVGAFSGSHKEYGRQMKLGLEVAFQSQNDAGGVHGRRLRLFPVDDGYEPARTLGAMQELCDGQHVFGYVGNLGTPTAAVALPFALERKMLFFGAFSGASLLRRDPPDRYVFNYRASYAEETGALVKYLVKLRHLRPQQIAVFAQEDAFGDAGVAGVAKAMRNLGADARLVQRIGYKRNTVDVADAVAAVARSLGRSVPLRAVVMVATSRAAAKFIEKVRDLNPSMIFTTGSYVDSSALAEELSLLGARYAGGVVVTQVVPAVDGHSTTILNYRAALAKYAPEEKPDYISLEAYLTAKLLIEGLRRAGRRLDTEKLVDALESIRDLDVGIGTVVNLGPDEHQGSHKVWGTELDEAGRYRAIELE